MKKSDAAWTDFCQRVCRAGLAAALRSGFSQANMNYVHNPA